MSAAPIVVRRPKAADPLRIPIQECWQLATTVVEAWRPQSMEAGGRLLVAVAVCDACEGDVRDAIVTQTQDGPELVSTRPIRVPERLNCGRRVRQSVPVPRRHGRRQDAGHAAAPILAWVAVMLLAAVTAAWALMAMLLAAGAAWILRDARRARANRAPMAPPPPPLLPLPSRHALTDDDELFAELGRAVLERDELPQMVRMQFIPAVAGTAPVAVWVCHRKHPAGLSGTQVRLHAAAGRLDDEHVLTSASIQPADLKALRARAEQHLAAHHASVPAPRRPIA